MLPITTLPSFGGPTRRKGKVPAPPGIAGAAEGTRTAAIRAASGVRSRRCQCCTAANVRTTTIELLAVGMYLSVMFTAYALYQASVDVHATNQKMWDMLDATVPLVSEESIQQLVETRETISGTAASFHRLFLGPDSSSSDIDASALLHNMTDTVFKAHNMVVVLSDLLANMDAMAAQANATHLVLRAEQAVADMDAVLLRLNTAFGAMGGATPPAASVGA